MQKTEILIIGAGPSGLITACQLAKFGVKFRIVDKKKGPSKHSKAIGIQPRTLELFEQMGIIDEFIKNSEKVKGAALVTRKGKLYPFNIIETSKKFSKHSILFLEQHITERILIQHLKKLGHNIEWETKLTDFKNTETKVTASFNSKNKKIDKIEAHYLVAADGASSTVRENSNLEFSGGTYNQVFSLADVKIKWKLSYNRIFIHFHKKGFLIFFPFKNKTHRIISSLPSNTNPDNFQFSDLKQFTIKTFPIPVKIDPKSIWFSNFRLHHRAVENFRHKNIFFVGDAAHIHSPVGGQGMNTGIQDAYNLAWKLGLVIKHTRQAKILDTYNQERLPFAKALLKTTDFFFNAAYRRSFKFQFFRLFIAPIIFFSLNNIPRLRQAAFFRIGQLWIRYFSSLSNKKFSSGLFTPSAPKPGERTPCFKNLYSQLSETQFTLLVISKQPIDCLRTKLKMLLTSEQYHLLKIKHLKPTSSLKQNLKITKGLYLIRPDTYIALRSKTLKVSNIKEYLEQLT